MSFVKRIFETFVSKEKAKKCGAIILAAGQGSRMDMEGNKQFLLIAGKPVLAYSLEAFQNSLDICEIVVVAREEEIMLVSDIAKEYGITKLKNIVVGGDTRTDSALHGVLAYADSCDYFAVHDGARPFVSGCIISDAVEAAKESRAAAPGILPSDTIKEINADGCVAKTHDRSKLRLIQTPQVFEAGLLRRALFHVKENKIPVTDDCAAVELLGVSVRIVEGDRYNLKITTPDDIDILEAIAQVRGSEVYD